MVRMNVAPYQEKKDENTSNRKAGKEIRQANFKEAACYPFAVVQRAAWQKNDLCEESARGNWDLQEGQQPFEPNPNGVGDRTTTLRRLLIGAVQFCSLFMYILHIEQKVCTSLSKKIGINTCFEDGQKVRNDDLS